MLIVLIFIFHADTVNLSHHLLHVYLFMYMMQLLADLEIYCWKSKPPPVVYTVATAVDKDHDFHNCAFVTVQAAAVYPQDCGDTFQAKLRELVAIKQTCDSGLFHDCCQVW